MRPIYVLAVAVITTFLPGASYADDYDDCRATCTFEKDTRNMNCPSPYDASDQERSQCLKNSQSSYEDCVKHCPASPPSSSGGQVPPPPSSY